MDLLGRPWVMPRLARSRGRKSSALNQLWAKEKVQEALGVGTLRAEK